MRDTEHGSWLNIVETLFGKMYGKDASRATSVFSLEQNSANGYSKALQEINAAPVVHRWRKFDALKPADREMV